MQLYDRTQRKGQFVEVDPEGFAMPYEVYSDSELENIRARYFKLTNRPKHLLAVRCNGLIFGGGVQRD